MDPLLLVCKHGSLLPIYQSDRDLDFPPPLRRMIWGGDFAPPEDLSFLQRFGITRKEMRAVIAYFRSGVILGDKEKTLVEKKEALVDTLVYFGGCPALDQSLEEDQREEARMKKERLLREMRSLRKPPSFPYEDYKGEYEWERVPGTGTPSPGFGLTGTFTPGGVCAWARKLI